MMAMIDDFLPVNIDRQWFIALIMFSSVLTGWAGLFVLSKIDRFEGYF
tara:strand:- start:403 stop:546 length:144 start_codon:yes stop_codon:yes gene_type:complete